MDSLFTFTNDNSSGLKSLLYIEYLSSKKPELFLFKMIVNLPESAE